jgi:hypothetical protein
MGFKNIVSKLEMILALRFSVHVFTLLNHLETASPKPVTKRPDALAGWVAVHRSRQTPRLRLLDLLDGVGECSGVRLRDGGAGDESMLPVADLSENAAKEKLRDHEVLVANRLDNIGLGDSKYPAISHCLGPVK